MTITEWTIQRHWQHYVHITQDDDKQNKTQHNKNSIETNKRTNQNRIQHNIENKEGQHGHRQKYTLALANIWMLSNLDDQFN